jgi:CRP/FNR family transcriptional regulator, cyclic AMP receptor protein
MTKLTRWSRMSPKMLEKHLELLRGIPLFEGLSSEQLARVANVTEVRRYPARGVVVTQGEPATELFAVVRGRLKVSSSNADGRDTVLGIMAEGEVFGEVALLDGGLRSATCSAVEPCELLVVSRAQFLELLENTPGIAVKLLLVLSRRLRRLSQRSEDTAFLDVPSRLARCLLDLAARFGEARGAGVFVTLKLSQQELGDLIGATRESVNKNLAEWTRLGLLQLEAGRLLVSDVDGLRKLARLDEA